MTGVLLREWINMQEALLAVFGPLGAWMLIFYVVAGIFLAINIIWLTMIRYMWQAGGRR